MNCEKEQNEVIDKLKSLIGDAKKQGHIIVRIEDIEKIIPETKESEDERIRKELLEHCKNQAKPYIQTGNKCPQIQSWIAWLEKQGEQKTAIEAWKEMRLEVYAQASGNRHEANISDDSTKMFSLNDIDEIFEKIGDTVVEQKSVDKVESKFHEGEWITNGDYTWRIVEVKSLDYILQSQDGNIVDDTISHVDEQFHSFTIEEAKDGDILATEDWVFIFKKMNPNNKPSCYCHYDTELGFSIDTNSYIATGSEFHPATKEQRAFLFKKMNEAGYTFDFEKKKLKEINKNTDVVHEYFSELLENDNSDNIDDYAYQCAYCMSHDWIKESPTWDDVERACKLGAEWNEKHHKSAWSEEDKDFMYDTLSNLAELKGRYGEGYGNVGKCIDWLKSIKDRIQPIHEYSDTEKQEMFIRSQRPHFWRPSDEQMDALNDVISSRDIKYDVLSELWKDLNKLRGK